MLRPGIITFLLFPLFLTSVFACQLWVTDGSRPRDRSDLAIKITEVKGNVYLVEDFNYWKTNTVFYAHPKGTLFFNSTWTEKGAARVLWKAAAISESEYAGVFLSSYGLHHSGGLGEFRRQAVRVFMFKKTYAYMLDKWEPMQADMQKSFSSWVPEKITEPDGLIGQEAKMVDGAVQLYFPGHAHTLDNLVVFFPEEKILYAGSLLSSPMYFMREANRRDYGKVLRRLKRFQPEIIISGHGKAIRGPEFLDQIIQKMELKQD